MSVLYLAMTASRLRELYQRLHQGGNPPKLIAVVRKLLTTLNAIPGNEPPGNPGSLDSHYDRLLGGDALTSARSPSGEARRQTAEQTLDRMALGVGIADFEELADL